MESVSCSGEGLGFPVSRGSLSRTTDNTMSVSSDMQEGVAYVGVVTCLPPWHRKEVWTIPKGSTFQENVFLKKHFSSIGAFKTIIIILDYDCVEL